MKNIFLDTNFLIDFFVREGRDGETEKVLQLGDKNNMKFYISYLSVANFAYIMRRMPLTQLKDIISRICNIFEVVDNTRAQIMQNILTNFKDFEDGLQYQCALAGHCDCIISRNKKDFVNAAIPVLTPSEFIANHIN